MANTYNEKFQDDKQLTMWWDTDTLEMFFEATMPVDTWFAIGFGKQMSGSDIIMWHANGPDAETEPFAGDYFCNYGVSVEEDAEQSLETTYERSGDGKSVTFKTKRLLDTSDLNDYAVPNDGLVNMIYAWNSE